MLSHGWEPNTPARLLYNAWVGQKVGEMCVEQWEEENIERVQSLRDEASANYRETSAARKGNWNKTRRPRNSRWETGCGTECRD